MFFLIRIIEHEIKFYKNYLWKTYGKTLCGISYALYRISYTAVYRTVCNFVAREKKGLEIDFISAPWNRPTMFPFPPFQSRKRSFFISSEITYSLCALTGTPQISICAQSETL